MMGESQLNSNVILVSENFRAHETFNRYNRFGAKRSFFYFLQENKKGLSNLFEKGKRGGEYVSGRKPSPQEYAALHAVRERALR